MERNFLSKLKCPFCNSDIKANKIFKFGYGILKCSCSHFPLVEDIPVIKRDVDVTLNYIKKNKFKLALFSLFEIEGPLFRKVMRKIDKVNFLNLVKNKVILRYKIFIYRALNRNLRFCDTVKKFKWGGWTEYLIYRFSSESFFTNYALLSLINNKNSSFLDIGCGTGHNSFLVKQLFPNINTTLLDSNFIYLLLAKKFFINDNLICADSTNKLPFKNKYSVVFNSDSFHYIIKKGLLADEMKRAVDKNGIIILSHLHNKLKYNYCAGMPLTYLQYKNLFKNLNLKVIPEEIILKDFFNNKLDLTQNYSENELNNAKSFALIISNKKRFRVYKNVNKKLKKNLIINPVYKTKKSDNKTLLKLKFPSKMYEKDNILIKKYMKNNLIFNLKEDKNEFIEKFVLINVPKKFKNENITD